MSSQPSGVAIEVNALTIRYADLVAVDSVSFAASHGEVTALLGRNGAGKTSTLEACEGLRRATSGSVRVLGADAARLSAAVRARMGVMLQDGGIAPGARVRHLVRHYCVLYGRGADADEILQQVALRERASSPWRRLSGGERQRFSPAPAPASPCRA